MVNNAGINVEALQPVKIHETSEELYDQTLAINTKGVFLGLKYATAQMMKQNPHHSGDLGWIINISSIMGLVGLENCRWWSTPISNTPVLTPDSCILCIQGCRAWIDTKRRARLCKTSHSLQCDRAWM